MATSSASSSRSHRAALWSTTAPSSPPHVAPGTAAPRARQCPASMRRPVPRKQRSASAAATSSDADTLRATAWSSGHGLRPPLCFQQSGFTQPALRVCQSERWSAVTEGPASLRIVLTVVVHRSACHTLRFYITPHLPKRPSIHSQARSMAERRFAPFGFGKQALCKVSCTGGSPRFACFPVGAPTPPYARAPVPARGLQAL